MRFFLMALAVAALGLFTACSENPSPPADETPATEQAPRGADGEESDAETEPTSEGDMPPSEGDSEPRGDEEERPFGAPEGEDSRPGDDAEAPAEGEAAEDGQAG